MAKYPIRTIAAATLFVGLSGCVSSSYNDRLEAIGAMRDFDGVASVDLCDAAAYFTYDALPTNRQAAQRLLAEVLRRGDISRSEYNDALTGDVELGMRELAVVCAWGLPSGEEEYFLADGRKYTRWVYRFDRPVAGEDELEFINDRVTSINTAGG
jgi:hypothetical protein